MKNNYTNTRLEFHILQSFPTSCLNRDDVGAPKSAVIGGIPRARVSSQCWKRAVRLTLHELGIKTASRTRLVVHKIAEECKKRGASDEQAKACGEAFAKSFAKSVKEYVSDTMFFISPSEAVGVSEAYEQNGFDASKLKDKELVKLCKSSINPAHDGLDIALFGRMVANAPEMNVEAAASFAHAISTHKAAAEVEFFTAVDDCRANDESGSGHMGSLEYNSATYYRYISLDLGQLAENMKAEGNPEEISKAVEAFTKALFIAIPSARQKTMAAACPWNHAVITLRKGQNIQLNFNTPVGPVYGGKDLIALSTEKMNEQLNRIENMYGSLYGLQKKFEFGLDTTNSIDDLINDITGAIESLSQQ